MTVGCHDALPRLVLRERGFELKGRLGADVKMTTQMPLSFSYLPLSDQPLSGITVTLHLIGLSLAGAIGKTNGAGRRRD